MGKKYKLTTERRDALINALKSILDTRDKRFMFLRMEFNDLVSMINIEGSAHDTAWNIYLAFEKQQMLGSLMACLNSKLGADLYLEFDD